MHPQLYDALTGEQYLSPSHAAEALGVSLPTVHKSIKTGAAIKNKKLNTYTWVVAPTTPALRPPKDDRQQPIHCITTNTTYATMSEACTAHGIDLTALSRALRQDKPLPSKTFGKRVKFKRIDQSHDS